MAGAAIDAVITWVDGDDPAHAARRAAFSGSASTSGTAATRFAARDELRHCLRSILRHAPFLRRIHVVTDRQVPAVLAEMAAQGVPGHEKIRLVDHREIFRGHEALLPVFNSISIEAMVHRTLGLAEQFVMFNDDMFLTAPIVPEDWFREGRPVFRGRWFGPGLDALAALRRVLAPLPGIGKATAGFSNKESCRLGARAAGLHGRTFVPGHAPYPGLVSGYAALMAADPGRYLANAAHRFRAPSQFNVVSLLAHALIAGGAAHLQDEGDLVYLRADRDSPHRVAEKLRRIEAPGCRFLCVQSLDQASPAAAAQIAGWLDSHLAGDPDSSLSEGAVLR